MSIPHAGPGEVADVRPLGAALATTGTRTLVKTEAVTVVRLVVLAGKEIPSHTAKGELIVQCLEWKIAFVNLLGCILFGVSAVAGFIVPDTGDVLDLAVANVTTSWGALCFLVGAVLLLPEGADVTTTIRPATFVPMNTSRCRCSASSELSKDWWETTQSATGELKNRMATAAKMKAKTMATT